MAQHIKNLWCILFIFQHVKNCFLLLTKFNFNWQCCFLRLYPDALISCLLLLQYNAVQYFLMLAELNSLFQQNNGLERALGEMTFKYSCFKGGGGKKEISLYLVPITDSGSTPGQRKLSLKMSPLRILLPDKYSREYLQTVAFVGLAFLS